jgi:hypothetical protein
MPNVKVDATEILLHLLFLFYTISLLFSLFSSLYSKTKKAGSQWPVPAFSITENKNLYAFCSSVSAVADGVSS